MTQAPTQDQDAPEIIIVKLGAERHFVVKGESYLDAMMFVDGDFPTPIACLYFEDIMQAKMKVGHDFNPQAYWQIHPEIVARLRDANKLMETDV